MDAIKFYLKRPYIGFGRFRLYLWAGEWSGWDRQRCYCHDVALYVGPLGFEKFTKGH